MLPNATQQTATAQAAASNDRGVAMAASRRYDDALAHFDRAIALEPTLSAAHVNRALALLMTGRLHEALGSADHAIATRADSAEAWNLRGQILGSMHRTEEALGCFERALALRPGFAEAAANRTIASAALSNASRRPCGVDCRHPAFRSHANRGNFSSRFVTPRR